MSALTTVFFQECPTCGRTLRVAVKYFGRSMSCGHCGGEFLADPNSMRSTAPIDPTASARVIVDLAESARIVTSPAPRS
jgi:hypothetical protein